jgi:phosphoglycolate phosphatase-like HAD superfamily hydrolase
MATLEPVHLVWDWNGTLLDDMTLVVEATNASLAELGAGPVSVADHRRDFRRPVSAYYASVIGRDLGEEEFARLNDRFHLAYRAGLATCALSAGARGALTGWGSSQSLLSMWYHEQLVPTISRYRLAHHFARVDGLRDPASGGHKAPHLAAHLDALGIDGRDCVLIGDSIDDADAARSVGARIVLYGRGFTDPERLRETGYPVVDSLTEAVRLAGAVTA